jgi:outer membrane biosynthesis protein TonB
MSALTAIAVSLVVLGADKVPEPPSGPNPFLTQAKDLYGKLEFEKCLKRVAQAQQWRSSPKELLEIELYAGLCHFNLGQKPDAEERFKTALRIDPGAELPPYTTPLAVTLFSKLKKSMKPQVAEKEKEKPPEKEREQPPPDVIESPPEEKEKPVAEVKPRDSARSEEPDEEPPPKKSDAPVAKKLTPKKSVEEDVVTPGQPSFVVRKAPAIALTGVAAVGLGFGIGFGAATRDMETKALAAEFESDFFKLKQRAEANAIGANVSYGVAAAAAVVAVVLWVTGN